MTEAAHQKGGLVGGEPVEPERLVAYSPGSVVSRALVKNAAGSVTLFAFDAGQELSEHTAPFDALVQVLDGEGDFKVGVSWAKAAAGEILLLPAGVPHAVKAERPFKMLLTMLRAPGA